MLIKTGTEQLLKVFGWQGHIMGALNTEVDRELRGQANRTEWMLNKLDFLKFIKELCFISELELVTARFNKQPSVFVC